MVHYFSEEVYTAEIEESDEYYLTDTVASGKLYTEVRYAYIDKPYGEPIICVNCVIQNNSPENITFVASDYFSLDNEGIIKTATVSDYDYVEIATGAKIVTDIKFVYPSNANMGFYNMTMTIEDTLVSLADKPQSESEKMSFMEYIIGLIMRIKNSDEIW